MKIKSLLTTVLLAISVLYASAQDKEYIIEPDCTYMFERQAEGDLFFDVYNPAPGSKTEIDGKKKPTIMFMFGGGFIRGTRNDSDYHKWFKMLTDNGFRVISIDYRLGLKGSNKVGVAQVNVLDKAIHMAVEDLYSATAYICNNAEQLGVDITNIVISGSSAGAISVMQAEYELCNQTKWTSKLPEGFRYAGVMSFSGAILSREGEVDYARTPAPMLMLHGTADELVNYNQIKFFNLGFFGGGKLVRRFEKLGFNYNMYHFVGYGHEIAGAMETTFDLQMRFIETNVMQGKRRIIEAWVDDPDVYKGVGVQSRKDLYGNK